MYCSISEIENIIPEDELINLTVDDPSNESVVNVQRFNDVSVYADELINGYLRARYTLPLKCVPALISKLAADIVAYRLHLRRPQDIPEHISENHKLAIRTLQELQKGNIILDLPVENPDMQPIKSSYLTNKNNNSRIFNDSYFNQYRG
ncbi:MAG: DUF1320 domain-containing protein [Candidatus Gastranaerophilales bacterium]|nr:DUF1320 domain-containing protein [Candidatus Gastranaerophilales bacterium]